MQSKAWGAMAAALALWAGACASPAEMVCERERRCRDSKLDVAECAEPKKRCIDTWRSGPELCRKLADAQEEFDRCKADLACGINDFEAIGQCRAEWDVLVQAGFDALGAKCGEC